jgi:hypothetical protein
MTRRNFGRLLDSIVENNVYPVVKETGKSARRQIIPEGYFAIPVSIYQTTRRHIQVGSYLHHHHCKNPKDFA